MLASAARLVAGVNMSLVHEGENEMMSVYEKATSPPEHNVDVDE